MRQSSLEHAAEGLAVALVLPALVAAAIALNPLLGVLIAGVGLAHAVVLALPIYLLLRRFGRVGVVSSTLAGLAVGAVPAAVVFSDIPGQFIPFALFGAASGFIFGVWLWIRSRPGFNPSVSRTV